MGPDKDIRQVKNRGFRRHVKLKLKDGLFHDLPEAPRKVRIVPETEP